MNKHTSHPTRRQGAGVSRRSALGAQRSDIPVPPSHIPHRPHPNPFNLRSGGLERSTIGDRKSAIATAFTLIEVLVVISIIGVVVGISFPYIRSMVRTSSEQMAANSLSNGVSAARAYSTRYKPFLSRDPYTGRTSEDNGDGYSGAAAIITPALEVRISENDETADGGGFRLELPPSGQPIRNGYRPIEDLDDLRLSGRVAILGITRTGTNELTLLPPPFAINFNRRGQMVVRSTAGTSTLKSGLVYYDADGDGTYDTGSTRATFGGTYSEYFRGVADKISDVTSPMDGYYELPWEVIEPVIGVVIFDPNNVKPSVVADTGPTTGSGDGEAFDRNRADAYVINTNDADTDILEWASKPGNGVVMFFNRFTGADTTR